MGVFFFVNVFIFDTYLLYHSGQGDTRCLIMNEIIHRFGLS
jgi:hypothetical protein